MKLDGFHARNHTFFGVQWGPVMPCSWAIAMSGMNIKNRSQRSDFFRFWPWNVWTNTCRVGEVSPWWPDRCSLWVGLAGPVEHQMALGMIGCSLSFDMTCFSDFGLFGLFGFYKHYQLIIICWNICSEISKISVCWLSVAFYRRSSCTSNWWFFPFGMLSSGWILTGSRLNPCWCLLVKSVLVFFES